MKLVRCNNGHFYDEEKYAGCPHCEKGVGSDHQMTVSFAEDVQVEYPMTQPMQEDVSSVSTAQRFPSSMESSNMTVKKNLDDELNAVNRPVKPQAFYHDDDDHTVSYIAPDQEVGKKSGFNPVVGWLIALNGVHIGRDFRLTVGKNFIGRDSKMDIALTGEKSVSRSRHAVIVYEPKQHMYLIQAGDSKELTYLNDEVVLESVRMKSYDIIVVGEVQLLFISLCNETFNWADILK